MQRGEILCGRTGGEDGSHQGAEGSAEGGSPSSRRWDFGIGKVVTLPAIQVEKG